MCLTAESTIRATMQDTAEILDRAASLASIELQRNGFVPSSLQVQNINAMTFELSSLLLRLGGEDDRLRALRQLVCTQIDIQRSIAAPVRRLPPEILALVFIQFVEVEDQSPYRTPRLVLLTVGRVCSTWRIVARSTPELWTHIWTQVHNPTVTYPDYAAMSGALPLYIAHTTLGRHNAFHRVLKQLRPQAARWCSVILVGSCSSFSKQPAVALPSLRVAKLSLRHRSKPGVLDFLACASELRILEIRYIIDRHDNDNWTGLSIEFDFPAFSVLTHLLLDFNEHNCIPADKLLHLLSDCSASLTHLSLNCIIRRPSIDAILPAVLPIEMPSLLVAKITGACCGILECIIAPAINKLVLTNNAMGLCDPILVLSTFMSHSPHHSAIERLTLIDGFSRHPEDIIGCLEQLEGLQELRVEEMAPFFLTGAVLDRLTCTDDRPPLLPRLTRMKVKVRDEEMLSEFKDALRAMSQSRQTVRRWATRQVAALEPVEVVLGFGMGSMFSDEDELGVYG